MDRDGTGADSSFDRRLKEARDRHRLDPEPSPPEPSGDPSAFAVFFRVGVELVSALLVGLAIGWGLDRVLHTRPLFLILFVLLGGVAGMLNVWRLVKPPPLPGAPPDRPAGR